MVLAAAVCLLPGPAAAAGSGFTGGSGTTGGSGMTGDSGMTGGSNQAAAAVRSTPNLADALRTLQDQGLRLVFSSEIVTPDMRVLQKPKARTPRAQLDELLQPHGLTAEEGPGRIVQIVRARPPEQPQPRRTPATSPARPPGAPGPVAHAERVMVTAPVRDSPLSGVGAGITLRRDDWRRAESGLPGDPLRVVQSMPRVAAAADFRGEFSVRASPYRHVAVVVDGMLTPWLRHAAYGRSDAGSISMISADVLEDATLLTGAYPQRFGDRLGAQLGLTLRQGSRAAARVSGAVSGTHAGGVAEGPLGQSHRGSWLVAARHSLLDWPLRRRNPQNPTAFGFSDVQSKLVYDVRPNRQAVLTVLGGRTGVEGSDDVGPGELANGRSRAGAVSLGWRSTFGRGLVIDQQAHVVAQAFRNKQGTGQDATTGHNTELSYRAGMTRAVPGGMVEAGSQVQRLRSRRSNAGEATGASSWLRAGYLSFAWQATPAITLTPGVRVAGATGGRPAVARWVLAEWALPSRFLLSGSAGVSWQHPDLVYRLGRSGRLALEPERAAHADVSISQQPAPGIRWQVSVFNRRERDVLRAPGLFARTWSIEGQGLEAEAARYQNALTGTARGVEVLVERRRETGLSGWAAYSYGWSRQTDAERRETFWSDFDQRHAVNVSARYAFTGRTSAGVTFRGGSSFPIPGYLTATDGVLYAGTRRNDVRLPAYARLDARAQHTLAHGARRLTLYVEVLNVLDRANVGLAEGHFIPSTGQAVGFTEKMFPRLPTAGIRIDF
jgi:hypothetical protein